MNGREDVVQLLLDNNACVAATNADGEEPQVGETDRVGGFLLDMLVRLLFAGCVSDKRSLFCSDCLLSVRQVTTVNLIIEVGASLRTLHTTLQKVIAGAGVTFKDVHPV